MHHMHIAAILPVCTIPIISAVSINVWMFDSIYLVVVLTYIQIANSYIFNIISAVVILRTLL